MYQLSRTVFTSLCLICLLSTSYAQASWEMVEESDDISVYVKKAEGTGLKDVKIKGRIKCSMAEIVKALEDIETQKEWVKSTIDARYVEKDRADHFFFYISTDMPYPVKDRDVVIEYNRLQDSITKIVSIDYKGVPTKLPDTDGFVRIPQFQASYTLKPDTNGIINLEYLLKVDVGGSMPKWIVNLAITKGPIDTIESLFELIKSGHYKGVTVKGVSEL